jgi:nucleotide-binding universal stress UspA family protein
MRSEEATQVTAIKRRSPATDQNQPSGSLMFQRILIPVSDCPCSERAAETAIQLSRLLGGRLVFLHVLTDDRAKPEGARCGATPARTDGTAYAVFADSLSEHC